MEEFGRAWTSFGGAWRSLEGAWGELAGVWRSLENFHNQMHDLIRNHNKKLPNANMLLPHRPATTYPLPTSHLATCVHPIYFQSQNTLPTSYDLRTSYLSSYPLPIQELHQMYLRVVYQLRTTYLLPTYPLFPSRSSLAAAPSSLLPTPFFSSPSLIHSFSPLPHCPCLPHLPSVLHGDDAETNRRLVC